MLWRYCKQAHQEEDRKRVSKICNPRPKIHHHLCNPVADPDAISEEHKTVERYGSNPERIKQYVMADTCVIMHHGIDPVMDPVMDQMSCLTTSSHLTGTMASKKDTWAALLSKKTSLRAGTRLTLLTVHCEKTSML